GGLARLAQLLAQAVGLTLCLLRADPIGLGAGAHLVGGAPRLLDLAPGLLGAPLLDGQRVADVVRLLPRHVRFVPRPLRLAAGLLELALEVADLDPALLGVAPRAFE